jgi:hypothetical protein
MQGGVIALFGTAMVGHPGFAGGMQAGLIALFGTSTVGHLDLQAECRAV